MVDFFSESNRLKQLSGQNLQQGLSEVFSKLVEENVISSFETRKNFSHGKFSYKNQYLANFVIKTLDDKYIIIRSSNSFRSDRVKIPFYDILGIVENSSFSEDIIASVLLFPESELENSTFVSIRNKLVAHDFYCPASHLFVVSEFLEFIENHKISVEIQKEEVEEQPLKDGSYFGKAGNRLEKNIVELLNNSDLFFEYKNKSSSSNLVFDSILNEICRFNNFPHSSLIDIYASNTILKLRNGGNAKTDIFIRVGTESGYLIETISVKNTTKNQVSCHDYKCEDFIRVLNCKESKLKDYLTMFQEFGAYNSFESALHGEYSLEDFESLMHSFSVKLTEWALTGEHDNDNLIDREKQISKYIFTNKNGKIVCKDMRTYIDELYKIRKLKYGVPFSWTYPSKQRTKRIQLKLPILDF